MSSDEAIQQIIKKIVLRNAIEYGGSAKYDVVISKVVGLRPDLLPMIKEIIHLIKKIVDDVNSLDFPDQEKMASKLLVFQDVEGCEPQGRAKSTSPSRSDSGRSRDKIPSRT